MDFLLLALEFLELARHDPLVAFRPDPARVPVRESGDRLARFARLAPAFLNLLFLWRAFGDVLVHVGEVRVIVVADRADREAARAVAERADDAQQTPPETKQAAHALRQRRDGGRTGGRGTRASDPTRPPAPRSRRCDRPRARVLQLADSPPCPSCAGPARPRTAPARSTRRETRPPGCAAPAR